MNQNGLFIWRRWLTHSLGYLGQKYFCGYLICLIGVTKKITCKILWILWIILKCRVNLFKLINVTNMIQDEIRGLETANIKVNFSLYFGFNF